MYPVSEEYKAIIQNSQSIERRLIGKLDNINFTGDDILAGSFSYSGQIVHSTDIRLGGVFIQSIKFSFLQPFSDTINRGTWKGRELTISIGLDVNGTFEDVPLGVFVIDDAMHSAVGVDITAYCNMSKFDTARGMTGTMTGTLYDIGALACLNCGVTFGMTAEEFAELPNGTGIFSPYEPNDIENWHDVISWIANTVCGYATMNRDGELVFRTWTDEATMDISQDVRFDDGRYSDFETFYTGISVVNMKTQMTEYLGMPVDDGLTMNLGSNPFLQYGTDAVRLERKQAILTALQKFRYVPFSVSTYLDPAFDLGDVFNFPGGRAANSKCCVMKIDYSFSNGLKLAGYGNDPALANARSKVDKNLAGLLSQTDGKTIRYYTFTNPGDIYDIVDEETIGSFYFATVEDTTATVWTEIQAAYTLDDEDTPMEVTVHYYLNGEEIAYTPIQTIGESGIHTDCYNYVLPGIQGGMRNEWTVTIECNGGTADINRNGVHVCLSGQGLVGEEAFLGIIEVSDTMPLFVVEAIEAGEFADSVSFALNNVDAIQATDNFSVLNVGGTAEADYILDAEGTQILDTDGDPILGAQKIASSAVSCPDFTDSVNLFLELDESLVMHCGDEFYAGDEFETGLFNTLV